MKSIRHALILTFLCVGLTQTGISVAQATSPVAPATRSAVLPDGLYAEVTTPRGVVVAELYYKQAPMTCANFVGLAEGTLGPKPRKPFFDGLTFHRVVPGFVVQGGDPTATGDGGPGYDFPDEIVPGLKHDGPGVLIFANAGPDTNGSQFVFMLTKFARGDYAHPIFGHVVRGLEILPLIQQGDTMQVKILRIGKDAVAFRADEKTFAKLVRNARRMVPTRFEAYDDVLPKERTYRNRYPENKLANLERFLGGKVFLRTTQKFTPHFVGQTPQQYVDTYTPMAGRPKGSVFAFYFTDLDRWVQASSSPAWVKRPEVPRREGPSPKSDQVDADARERERVLENIMDVINGYIVQFEHKRERKPSSPLQ